jgi:hypothetical protein
MAGNIQQFNAGDLGLRPSEVGVEARAGTARRIGMFSNQQASAEELLARSTSHLGGETQQLGRQTAQLGSEVGASTAAAGRAIGSSIVAAGDVAVKYLDNRQISEGAKSYAQLLQETTNDWNNRIKTADPNNPSTASDFMSALDERLANFQNNGFYTENAQKWAEGHVEALRQHFAEKTQSDMATMAGLAAKENARQTVNTLTATVHGDPTSVDFALAALKSSTDGIIKSNPNLTGTAAASVRTELMQAGAESIVKAAAIGYIDKTGQMPKWVTDPKYSPYVNATELQMFEKQAKAQQKANAYYDKQTAVAERQLADLRVHQGATKVLTDNVSVDPNTGVPIVKPQFFKDALDIARKNPDAPSAAETVRTMLNWGEAQQNKEAKAVDDPTTKQDLTDRLFSPDKPTTVIDLMKARAAGKLSDHSFTSMKQMVDELEQTPLKGPVWQATAAAVKDALIVTLPGVPGKDMKGSEAYASFMQTFIPQYIAKSRAGTLEPNALDVKDPNSMISKAMAPFKRTPAERMKDFTASIGGLGAAAPAEAPKAEGQTVPPALRGIAALQYNPSKKLWRDQTSGIIYDANGKQVTP